MSTDDFPDDVDGFRTAGKESWEHLWPKLELERRRRTQTEPFFHGEYRFERKVADRVPDCAVIGGDVNRWIEFVAGSDQPYREKTREALRLGFVVHWVFHTDHAEQKGTARDALTPELHGPFSFGEYNPDTGSLNVGDPVTFKNFRFPVESMEEFEPRELLGYRRGMARIDRVDYGYDLGMFAVAGVQRRILAYGTEFCAVAPGQSSADATWGFPTRDGLERLIETNNLTRLGPVRRD
ncbi:hypothetical protein ACOJIV_24570 [Haloarcula sp. AONF1]